VVCGCAPLLSVNVQLAFLPELVQVALDLLYYIIIGAGVHLLAEDRIILCG